MGFPGYIKVEKDKPTDPKLYDVVDRLLAAGVRVTVGKTGNGEDIPESIAREVLRCSVLGGIVTLWCYADRHIRDANVLPMSLQGASQVTGLPVSWLRELPKEWLTANDDGTVSLPNYRQHNHVISKAERDFRSESGSAVRMRRMRRKRKASLLRNGDVTRDASRDAPPVPVPLPLTGTSTGTEGEAEKSASPPPAPVKRAAAPRPKPEVAWRPPGDGTGWTSWSTPGKAAKPFADDFKARFGCTPEEASRQRAEAEAKEKPSRPPPKPPDEEIPR